MTQNSQSIRASPQVLGWIRQIQKEQATGLELETAAREARISFESALGEPLTEAQQAHWLAAQEEIRRSLEAPPERVEPNAIRKPRRPQWYKGPAASDANWPAFKAYLLERKRWAQSTVDSLDTTSTEIVSLLEAPTQPAFRGRGLVVGYVQSGKTANMMAVIAKAVDAGYKFVIVLAGLTNSLRTQTQGRFEADLRARNPLGWHLHTSRDDFRTPPNLWFSVMDQAQVAIVKKNVTPLRRLIKAIEKTPPALRERMPVLIIDDECDQASVNSSGSQFDMTAINGAIRRLLQLLPKVQYIGYTATPFANVLINPELTDGQLDDLYPEDFISALPPPAGYFGAESLFGKAPADAGDETPEETGLDMIREIPVPDAAAVRPPSARDRDQFDPTVPPSLDEALSYFLMATAARYARGQRDQHASMLVHTTVYTVIHNRLASAIRDWLDAAPEMSTTSEGRARLKALWDRELASVDSARWDLSPVDFEEVLRQLPQVLEDLEIVVENSSSDMRLAYEDGPRKYIVVGGSVLARGLTIEGLTVSYFVRSSNQYDTLLQMGRWFGYRPGYEDLPRIWMSPDLAVAFRDLGGVESEIRADIAEYARRDLTPADFAVRIRQLPGMAITAASKMVAAESCDVSFSGEHLQTIRFQHRDSALLDRNWQAGAALVSAAASAGKVVGRPQGRLIRDVSFDHVRTFLRSYAASEKDRFSDGLLDYIATEMAADSDAFRHWNIALIEPPAGKPASQALGAFGAPRMVTRSRLNMPRADGAADIKALMSRRDVLADVEAPAPADDWEAVKLHRQASVGDQVPLLLLYAIDPNSTPAAESKYRTSLDAVSEVLGVGLVLPDRGARKQYVRVRLARDEDGEDVLADLPGEED
ncbi:MAG: Z1 domain-containing protein [Caulobacter sp.]|nr:Z1 domain-containing protein [Caulobacter sp.]